MIRFKIPYPKNKSRFAKEYGLNAIYSGMHWAQRKMLADRWHRVVRKALLVQNVPQTLFTAPVAIAFFWDDRMDVDNHGFVGKLTVDALKGWLLKDDNPKWFVQVSHHFWAGGEILVEVQEI